MDDSSATRGQASTAAVLGRWLARGLRREEREGDWELLARSRAGDRSSAAVLVRRLTPQALGLALQLVGRREDAEDVVQDSFLRLWRAHPSDGRGATLATFFNTIVINRGKTCLARRREWDTDPAQLAELSDAIQQSEAEPAAADSALPGAARLQQALARLPARQRMALAMWAYVDADVARIACALELEPNAAHQLLHRAKAALRKLLEEDAP